LNTRKQASVLAATGPNYIFIEVEGNSCSLQIHEVKVVSFMLRSHPTQ